MPRPFPLPLAPDPLDGGRSGEPGSEARTLPEVTRPEPAGPDAMPSSHDVVLVTGPSGAGRSTAIRALEDLGWEVIDNLPLSLLPRLMEGPALRRPLALGLDTRNRDWSAEGLAQALAARPGARVLFLDCADEALLRRFSETRRRHPLSPDGRPEDGIARDRALLAPVRARADIVLDTTAMTPHELRAAVEGWFAPPSGRPLAVSLESFSYKQGLPPGLDMVLDCRFLRNPHWDEGLRPLDGRDARVAAFVAGDPRHGPFLRSLTDMLLALLPAFREEGKAHLGVGLGCTGGRHRSVALVEALSEALAAGGWAVSKRHRELERRAEASLPRERPRDPS